MKTMIWAAALAATVTIVQSTAQANLLLAPGFEAPAAPDATNGDSFTPLTPAAQNPWYGPRNSQQAYSSSVNSFNSGNPTPPARNRIGSGGNTAYEGTQYGYAYSVGNTFGYLAQNVTGAGVVPGDLYTASAYFNNKAATGSDGDQLNVGQSNDTVRLLFLDASGTQLGTTAVSPTSVNGATPRNTWTQVSVSAVAPADTATIVFQAYLTRGPGPTGAGGVMFVDAANLFDASAVPEPASLMATAGVAGLALVRRRRC